MKKGSLIALLGLSLSGCDHYPDTRTTAVVKMASKPIWGDLISQEVSLGGDCHIDSINGEQSEESQTHTLRQGGPALKVAGWGAISVTDGVIASHIAIALKSNSAHSTRLFAGATKGKRQDVAEYFKNPASVDTGFSVAIDMTDVSPGSYVLEVIQHKDGKDFKCHYISNIIVRSDYLWESVFVYTTDRGSQFPDVLERER